MFFRSCFCYFLQYIANVTHRTFEIVQKNRDPANIIIGRALSVELSEFSLYLFIYLYVYIYIYIFQTIRRARAVNAQRANVRRTGRLTF